MTELLATAEQTDTIRLVMFWVCWCILPFSFVAHYWNKASDDTPMVMPVFLWLMLLILGIEAL